MDISLVAAFGLPFPHLSPLIANIDASNVILNGGSDVAQSISSSWDSIWDSVLQGGIYLALCNVGILIALICLMMFIVEFAKKWLESGSGGDWVIAEIIIPLLVIVLLTNQGALLAELSKGMRDIINDVNTQVLTATAADAQFAATLSGLADHDGSKNQIQEIRSRCNTMTDNAKLQKCLSDNLAEAQKVASTYQSTHSGMSNWASDLQDYIQKAFSDPFTAIQTAASLSTPGGAISAVAGNAAISIGNTAATGIVEVLLLAFMTAFQHTIEAVLLLTALIAPIPIGASLLPFGAKPMYAWIAGFWSVGMMKISFNIIVGLIGTVIATAGPNATGEIVLAAILGVFSPLLAMGIAAGGGMALFQGICSGAQAAASKGVTLLRR